jgi:hypothetical protein
LSARGRKFLEGKISIHANYRYYFDIIEEFCKHLNSECKHSNFDSKSKILSLVRDRIFEIFEGEIMKEDRVPEETLIDASKIPDDQEWALLGWNYRADEQKSSSAPGINQKAISPLLGGRKRVTYDR